MKEATVCSAIFVTGSCDSVRSLALSLLWLIVHCAAASVLHSLSPLLPLLLSPPPPPPFFFFQHDNIIRLFDVYESMSELFIVMELCVGGELFDRIKAHPSGSYSEKDAQLVLRQICTGLSYLHKNRIVHCDLKPDNFLFADPSKESRLKIIGQIRRYCNG
jgi:serine/threonine protein kinase